MGASRSTTGAWLRQVVVVTICVVVTVFAARALGRQESLIAPVRCVASPVVASPVASSPIAVVSPQARGASAATTAVTAAIANLIACWNEADWQTSSVLVTDTYLAATFGLFDRAVYIALQERFDAIGFRADAVLIGVETVRDVGAGFATADVHWQDGNAIKSERWYLAQIEGRWLVDQIRPLPPELSGDIVGIELIVDDSGFHLSRDRIVNPGTVVIRVRNLTNNDISISLVRLATLGEVKARLSDGPAAGSDRVLSGQITVAAQESHDLVLADPREGEYTFVGGLTVPFGPDGLQDAFSAPLSVTSP